METNHKRRIQRLLKIILEVKTEPEQEVSHLLTKLNISKAQFYKDRAELTKIGFSFDYSRRKKRFIITEDFTLPIENLTVSELLSLVMAIRHLSASGDHILTYEGFRAAKKISAHLPEPLRANLFEDVVLQKGFKTDSRILDMLQQAVVDNRQVTLFYQRPEQDAPTQEIMDPYHIFFKRRALYVEGYSWSEKGIRVYRLSRIHKVMLGAKGFAIRPDYDFGKRYRNAFSAFPGETTEEVVVRFNRRIKPFIEESLWHHSQKIIPQKDGGILFAVQVAEPREVLWWSLSWGAGARIVSPEWLKQKAVAEIKKMRDCYQEI